MKTSRTTLARKSSLTLFAAMIALLVGTPPALHGQTLEDFRVASNAKGVDLIPFSDLRRDAGKIAEEVDLRKGQAQALSYDTFEKQKDNKLYTINKKNEEIAAVRKEMSDFKAKYKDASVSSFEDEIKRKEKVIAETNDELNDPRL